MKTLSEYQEVILKKICNAKKPLLAHGMQVRTCKALESMGLIIDAGGGWWCPTNDGRVLSAKLGVTNGNTNFN